MTATREDISGWFDRGLEEGATHVLVVCDTYDHDDYPVFVMPGEDVFVKSASYRNGENMQKLMEVYNMSKDKDAQMRECRSFNY